MDEKSRNEAKRLKEIIQHAHLVCFLGGAGVSTDSGISDFRSPQGLYRVQSKYGAPYEEMLSHHYFEEHPETFYDFYWSTMVSFSAKPNQAHIALAEFEKRTHKIVVITQNIDGLHQEAGSKNVLEVHGSTKRYRCTRCQRMFSLDEIPHTGVPHCPDCGAMLKPDVVLYEEPLDEVTLENAVAAVRRADVLFIAGTSLNVYPVAFLPQYFTGGTIAIINKEPTPLDSSADFLFHEDVGEVLPIVLSE